MKPIPLNTEIEAQYHRLSCSTDLRAGRMVVIMDDEDRENEGDLIMAAQNVRAEDINFMARFGARPHLPDADRASAAGSCACR